jgi:hypothetical protein
MPPDAMESNDPTGTYRYRSGLIKAEITLIYNFQAGSEVLLTAEAVEKANLLDHFIPDFFPSSIHPKSHITNYNL